MNLFQVQGAATMLSCGFIRIQQVRLFGLENKSPLYAARTVAMALALEALRLICSAPAALHRMLYGAMMKRLKLMYLKEM
ncbi:hypothetical protein [Hymenobacter fodinae]|uniref:hypothetical protein n=1 Tax=Hymenobacter fodinae TaxID=2510796 RepID=UPI001AEC09F4|nr:hypothetical protein [Hymenobacter fodinae]